MVTYCVVGAVLYWAVSLRSIHKTVRMHEEIAQAVRSRPKPKTGIRAVRPGTFTKPAALWATSIIVCAMVTPVVAVIWPLLIPKWIKNAKSN
jgi:hypothetical protein